MAVVAVVAIVAGTVQQIRVTNATNRINKAEASRQGEAAQLQNITNQADILEKQRRLLASNNAQAAAGGVSLTSGTVNAFTNASFLNAEQDIMMSNVNTATYVDDIMRASSIASSTASANNWSTGLSGIGQVATVGATAMTPAPTQGGG